MQQINGIDQAYFTTRDPEHDTSIATTIGVALAAVVIASLALAGGAVWIFGAVTLWHRL